MTEGVRRYGVIESEAALAYFQAIREAERARHEAEDVAGETYELAMAPVRAEFERVTFSAAGEYNKAAAVARDKFFFFVDQARDTYNLAVGHKEAK